MIKQGRNDPCQCGSGKKFKQCCQQSLVARTPVANSLVEQTRQALQAAWTHRQQGNFSKAEELCHQVMQDGRVDLATDYFSRAVNLSTKNPEFHSNLGLAFHEQGNLVAAEKQYRKAIAIKPDYIDAHYNLHAVLLANDDLSPAIKSIQKVVSLQPLDIDARYMLGVLLEYTGNADAASEQLEIVSKSSSLMKARLDAWNYIKSAAKQLPRITGSGDQIFRLGFTQAMASYWSLVFVLQPPLGKSPRWLISQSMALIVSKDCLKFGIMNPRVVIPLRVLSLLFRITSVFMLDGLKILSLSF